MKKMSRILVLSLLGFSFESHAATELTSSQVNLPQNEQIVVRTANTPPKVNIVGTYLANGVRTVDDGYTFGKEPGREGGYDVYYTVYHTRDIPYNYEVGVSFWIDFSKLKPLEPGQSEVFRVSKNYSSINRESNPIEPSTIYNIKHYAHKDYKSWFLGKKERLNIFTFTEFRVLPTSEAPPALEVID